FPDDVERVLEFRRSRIFSAVIEHAKRRLRQSREILLRESWVGEPVGRRDAVDPMVRIEIIELCAVADAAVAMRAGIRNKVFFGLCVGLWITIVFIERRFQVENQNAIVLEFAIDLDWGVVAVNLDEPSIG